MRVFKRKGGAGNGSVGEALAIGLGSFFVATVEYLDKCNARRQGLISLYSSRVIQLIVLRSHGSGSGRLLLRCAIIQETENEQGVGPGFNASRTTRSDSLPPSSKAPPPKGSTTFLIGPSTQTHRCCWLFYSLTLCALLGSLPPSSQINTLGDITYNTQP